MLTHAEGFVQLQPESSTPLYQQIASRLRYEIVTGRREAGSRLPPLREAASSWGVNLHTVRRAYKTIEAEGLAETKRPQGSFVAVLGPSEKQDRADGLEAFLARVATEAGARFGLGHRELAEAFVAGAGAGAVEKQTTPATETCCVVECSHTLSHALAGSIAEALGAPVRACDIRDTHALPAGPIVGTYFHADDLRKRLTGRTADLYLLRIRVAESQLERLRVAAVSGAFWKLVIVDRLPASAHDIAADFEATLKEGVQLEVRVLRDPMLGFPDESPGARVIASPQTWDELTPQLRARPDVELLEYEIEPGDVARLVKALG